MDHPTFIETINPTTGEVLNRYSIDDEARIARVVADSETGFRVWRDLSSSAGPKRW